MSGMSLKSVINEGLLSKLSKSGKASTRSGFSPSDPLISDSLSSSQNIGSALRVGARAFGTAMRRLNDTISVVNLSKSTLLELKDLTGDLIDLAERATQQGTQGQEFNRLDSEFNEIANKFKEIVNNADIGGAEYLTTEGLSEVFQAIGLDKSQSSSIAEIFNKLVTPDDADTLASEEIEGGKPVNVPSTTYGTGPTTETIKLMEYTRVSNTAAHDGWVTDVNSIYETEDTVVGNNPTTTSLISESQDAIWGAMIPGLSSSIEIMATNENTGYSVIKSSDDFLGFNGDGVDQFFVTDQYGTVVHQITNFTAAQGATLQSADISANNMEFAYTITAGGRSFAYHSETTDLGQNPSSDTRTQMKMVGGSAQFTDIKISDDGAYVAYWDNYNTTVEFQDVATKTSQATVPSGTYKFDFIGENDTIIIASSSAVAMYEHGTGAIGSYTVAQDLDSFTAINSEDTFAVRSTITYDIYTIAWDRDLGTYTPTLVLDLDNTFTVSQVSLAENSENGILDVGVVGKATGYQNLFRFSNSGSGYTAVQISNQSSADANWGKISEVNSVFGSVDDYLDYNTGVNSLITKSTDAVTVALPEGLTSAVEIFAVNKETGHAVIESTQDFLGYNSSNRSQLFIVDVAGRVIQQVTNNTNSNYVFKEADIDVDNRTIIARGNTQFTTSKAVKVYEFSDWGDNPTSTTVTDIESVTSGSLQDVKISNDGTHVAYRYVDGDDSSIKFRELATSTTDSFLASETSNYKFDFVAADKILIAQREGVEGTLWDIKSYEHGSSEYTMVKSSINNVGEFTANEANMSPSTNYQFIVEDTGVGHITMYTGTGEEVSTQIYDALNEDIQRISIGTVGTYNFGVFGDYDTSAGFSDSDTELYRGVATDTVVNKAGESFSRATTSYTGLFDSGRSLSNKPDAYRILNDLEALESQIDKNIAALDEATSVLDDNLSLVRSAGKAFLELSEQIQGPEDATKVASKLRQLIMDDYGSAFSSQIENLSPMLVQALTYDDSHA